GTPIPALANVGPKAPEKTTPGPGGGFIPPLTTIEVSERVGRSAVVVVVAGVLTVVISTELIAAAPTTANNPIPAPTTVPIPGASSVPAKAVAPTTTGAAAIVLAKFCVLNPIVVF